MVSASTLLLPSVPSASCHSSTFPPRALYLFALRLLAALNPLTLPGPRRLTFSAVEGSGTCAVFTVKEGSFASALSFLAALSSALASAAVLAALNLLTSPGPQRRTFRQLRGGRCPEKPLGPERATFRKIAGLAFSAVFGMRWSPESSCRLPGRTGSTLKKTMPEKPGGSRACDFLRSRGAGIVCCFPGGISVARASFQPYYQPRQCVVPLIIVAIFTFLG